jgi:hypothetical protein
MKNLIKERIQIRKLVNSNVTALFFLTPSSTSLALLVIRQHYLESEGSNLNCFVKITFNGPESKIHLVQQTVKNNIIILNLSAM